MRLHVHSVMELHFHSVMRLHVHSFMELHVHTSKWKFFFLAEHVAPITTAACSGSGNSL